MAGGFTGRAFVYSTRSGAPVADLRLTTEDSTLVNDVVVTKRAAYFTIAGTARRPTCPPPATA